MSEMYEFIGRKAMTSFFFSKAGNDDLGTRQESVYKERPFDNFIVDVSTTLGSVDSASILNKFVLSRLLPNIQ